MLPVVQDESSAKMDAANDSDDAVHHARLALDLLCILSNAFFIRVLFLSNIWGTHSFRVLIHSALSDLLLCAFSVILYLLDRTAAIEHYKLYVVSRLQLIFIMASFYCDFLLVINISLAVTLGVAYRVKVTTRIITSGLAASWVVAILVGGYAFTTSLANRLGQVKTETIVILSCVVVFLGLVVPAVSIVILFRRISVFVQTQATTRTVELRSILQARLDFVRVLKVLLGVRVLLYGILAGVTISMKYFGLSQSFEILIASNVAYNVCRVVIYLSLKKPLRAATERAVRKFFASFASRQKKAQVFPASSSVNETEM